MAGLTQLGSSVKLTGDAGEGLVGRVGRDLPDGLDADGAEMLTAMTPIVGAK